MQPTEGQRILSDAFLRRGIEYLKCNMFHNAVIDFDEAIRLTPDDKYAHWNKATALLSLGEYTEGFREHEWGWKLFSWRGFGPVKDDIDRLTDALPLFNPFKPLQRLLIYHELGFGDAIMVMRYLPILKKLTKSVTVVIDPALARLTQQFGVDVVSSVPQDLSRFDSRMPFFSVMAALGQTRDKIPREPYIKAEFKPTGAIGLCWTGRTQSVPFFDLAKLWKDYRMQSLQPGPVPDGVSVLEVRDFADTAKMIERMDHIITVDTAVAHLAGAMGHPSTHLLVPFVSDWRWWYADVWYPKINVYRQPKTGWRAVFHQVREAISQQSVVA